MADTAQPTKSGLSFRMTDGDRKLKAFYEPTDGEKLSINLLWLKEALAAAGFNGLFIHDHAFVELLKRYNAATQPFSFEIGERRDGSYIVRTTPDNVEAYLTITQPYGGKPVTTAQISQALKEQGIVHGIISKEIEAAVAAEGAKDLLIAQGKKPVPGTNGELVSLLPAAKDRQPLLVENDTVDYRNMGDIFSVSPGTPLMRRIPPEPGAAGLSLAGKDVPPPPVKDVRFAPNLTGTEISPDDPNLLIAAIAGQPVLVADGIIVEPVIKVKNVDLSTGNLIFNGSICVEGDVRAGMIVRATGDITIGGVVEAATVDGGGDIEIRGGIIGQGEVRNAGGEINRDASRVSAKGNVSALFAENALVEAGNSIAIQEVAMQSELIAGNQITVGQESAGKGHIIGGTCQAVNFIGAVTIGSYAGVHTLVSVGVDPHVRERLSSIKLKLQEKERELDEINKRLEYFTAAPHKAGPDQVATIQESREKLIGTVTEMTGEKKRLQKRLERVANAQIKVEKTVMSGVIVSIGNKALKVDEDLPQTVFQLVDDAIVTTP